MSQNCSSCEDSCQKGCSQSPIDVRPNVISAKRLDLQLHWMPGNGKPEWTDHGLKVKFPFSETNKIILDGTTYYLDEFHFHHPGEHKLEGQAFDAELHIVHKTKDKTKAAVIGIFLSVAAKSHRGDGAFFNALRKASKSSMNVQVPLNPNGWLPPNTQSAIRYEGSLTTPTYEEIVSWTILGVRNITRVQYAFIFGNTSPHARCICNLHRRYVVKYPWKP